ncbi:glucosaminidase domain-containing protein [Cohnella yongneupensis]|uniref:Glucosaminidase domain-containing protein n=1 Tax=Cohnella yongneupensis TaxID=425006 RepID=A0ABW0R371_9BACL
MHSEHRQWLAYLISVILLLCLAFYLVASIFDHANAASAPETTASPPSVNDVNQTPSPSHVQPPSPQTKSPMASAPVLPLQPATLMNAVQASSSGSPPEPPVPTPATIVVSEKAPVPPAPKEEIKWLTYETTAFYLNVREQPYSKAKIINVLEQGTIIYVLLTTDNGWLKLKDGGYVHGGYAKLLKDDVVRIASLSEPNSEQGSDQISEPIADDSEPNKPSSKVISDSGLTESDIGAILEGTDLADQGLEKAILDVEAEYGINAYFTIAVMKLESGNGESRLAKKKNNLFGLNAIAGDAYNKALSFDSKADCIEKFGQLIADKYVDQGYTTVEKVASKYCPANSRWSSHVKNIMSSDYKLL